MTQKELAEKKHKQNSRVYHLRGEEGKTRCGLSIEEAGKPQVLLTATEDRKTGKVCGKCRGLAEKKTRKPGVTAFVTEQLRAGVEVDKIVEKIKTKFPESKAGAKEVLWVHRKLQKKSV